MEERQPRKLAVILHADVVGSTALVQRNESVAHERMQDVFRRFSATIESYGGIAHEIRGDALVAEFARTSDAVSAALAFQFANEDHNKGVTDDIRPEIRIGITLGEVVIADGTITGAGVVLAQRLEQLAEPGGVCIQGAAYETVPQRLPFNYESLGEQKVKGFEEPVRVYTVGLEDGQAIPPPDPTVRPDKPVLELPDKPSFAVLPFTNMSGDPEQEYFSDGITEDIITELSRFRELLVIARNSTFVFKGQSVDVTDVSKQLGVRYVVEGSVRKAGNRVRVTAQLVDATTGNHVWAERYDRELEDIFAVQDEVVRAIVTALPGQLQHAELERAERKPPSDWKVYDLVLRASSRVLQESKPAVAEARPLLEQALAMDPGYALTHAWLCTAHLLEWVGHWSTSPKASLELALKHGRLAVKLDETSHLGHWRLSEVYLVGLRDPVEAKIHAERAVTLNPNASGAIAWMGFISGCLGKHDKGIELAREALRLDPLAPGWLRCILGHAYFMARRYDEAISAYKAASLEWAYGLGWLAASYAHASRIDEARATASSYLEAARKEMVACPLGEPESWIEFLVARSGYVRQEDINHFVDGLRKAGLPE